MYESHRHAFGDGKVQRCFVCRTDLPDYRFSEGYFTTLPITILHGMSKMHGISIHDIRLATLVGQMGLLTTQERTTQEAAQKTLRLFYSTKISKRSSS